MSPINYQVYFLAVGWSTQLSRKYCLQALATSGGTCCHQVATRCTFWRSGSLPNSAESTSPGLLHGPEQSNNAKSNITTTNDSWTRTKIGCVWACVAACVTNLVASLLPRPTFRFVPDLLSRPDLFASSVLPRPDCFCSNLGSKTRRVFVASRLPSPTCCIVSNLLSRPNSFVRASQT